VKSKYVFIIPGEPSKTYKSEAEGRQPLDTYREGKIRFYVCIENQFENEKLIKQPIQAIFKFYIKDTNKSEPSAIEMLRFANKMLKGKVYKHENLYNISILKEYSNQPHTEIIIKPYKPKGEYAKKRANKKI